MSKTTKPTVRKAPIDVQKQIINGQVVLVKIYAPVQPKIKYIVR